MNTRPIPTSYSGVADLMRQTRQGYLGDGREMVRPDIVRAVRLNTKIIRDDPYGLWGWPTSIRSEPVHLPLWGTGYDLTCPICGGHMERCECYKTYKPRKPT